MTRFFLLFFLISLPCFGQAWSGILSPSRAIDWTHAGLPATLPDGEATPNPWTPPTRSQCGSTIASGASVATISAALVACGSGTYVLLGPGTFAINSNLALYAANGGNYAAGTTGSGGVTLRGSGPQSTTLNLSGSAEIQFGISWNNGTCTWASGYSPGTTSIVVSGCSQTPSAGLVMSLGQCDTGYSGSGCTTGASADNGGLYICGNNAACQVGGEGTGGPQSHQNQEIYVSAVTAGPGNSTCGTLASGQSCIAFSPGVYMPNWSNTQTPFVSWITSSSSGNTRTEMGLGLEDLTIYSTTTANFAVDMGPSYASWIKGVRFLGAGALAPLDISRVKNGLLMNSYLFSDIAIDSNYPAALEESSSSDTLMLNNISSSGVPWAGEGYNQGIVVAFNYARDTFTAYYELNFFDHAAGSAFDLFEGNQVGTMTDDVTHGTDNLNTWFRNNVSGWDPPYASINPRGMEVDAYHRFDNTIANSVGNKGTAALINFYQASSGWNWAFQYGQECCGGDSLAATTAMRWGNCDTATNTCRTQSSEVPSGLPSPNTAFSNPVPNSTTIFPCSFFLAGYTSTSCAAHPNGGTGLSWWKVCTGWISFPTNCGTSQTQPFPPVGPDVVGGPYVNGTAYDIPAEVAWKNLPIDSAYQKTYSITSSSWSGGTETLRISGLPNVTHLMGGFQISGTSGCNSPTGGEFLMTSSNSATVSYALASNPGSCAGGSFMFPDVRQFDESVYESDQGGASGGGGGQPPSPTNLTTTVE